MSDISDDELIEQIAAARATAEQGDPAIFGPLLKQLEDAKTEQEAVVALLAITIADLDELEKQYQELRRGGAYD